MAQAPNAAILSPLAFLLPLRSYCLFRRDRPKACDSYGRLAHTAGAQGCCAAVPGREPGVFDGSNLSAPDHVLNGRTLETCRARPSTWPRTARWVFGWVRRARSEEHTSELQSRVDL